MQLWSKYIIMHISYISTHAFITNRFTLLKYFIANRQLAMKIIYTKCMCTVSINVVFSMEICHTKVSLYEISRSMVLHSSCMTGNSIPASLLQAW